MFKVLLLTAVSNDISQANVKAVIDARNDPRNRPLLRQSSSMAFQPYSDEVRYTQTRFGNIPRSDEHPHSRILVKRN